MPYRTAPETAADRRALREEADFSPRSGAAKSKEHPGRNALHRRPSCARARRNYPTPYARHANQSEPKRLPMNPEKFERELASVLRHQRQIILLVTLGSVGLVALMLNIHR